MQVREVVEEANRKWNDAFNRGDAAAVTALYAADAVLLPPGSSPISGADGIRDFWAGLLSNGFGDHRIEIVDVRLEGDLAYEAARWQATGPATAEGGGRQTYAGNLVAILKRQTDGSWKSQLHCWN